MAEKYDSGSGQYFYENSMSGDVTWERPAEYSGLDLTWTEAPDPNIITEGAGESSYSSEGGREINYGEIGADNDALAEKGDVCGWGGGAESGAEVDFCSSKEENDDWEAIWDDESGAYYYRHRATGETSWGGALSESGALGGAAAEVTAVDGGTTGTATGEEGRCGDVVAEMAALTPLELGKNLFPAIAGISAKDKPGTGTSPLRSPIFRPPKGRSSGLGSLPPINEKGSGKRGKKAAYDLSY